MSSSPTHYAEDIDTGFPPIQARTHVKVHAPASIHPFVVHRGKNGGKATTNKREARDALAFDVVRWLRTDDRFTKILGHEGSRAEKLVRKWDVRKFHGIGATLQDEPMLKVGDAYPHDEDDKMEFKDYAHTTTNHFRKRTRLRANSV